MNSKNNIAQDDRQNLYFVTKALLFAKDDDDPADEYIDPRKSLSREEHFPHKFMVGKKKRSSRTLRDESYLKVNILKFINIRMLDDL